MEAIERPALYMPFTFVDPNPAMSEATEGMWEWLRRMGIAETPAAKEHIRRSRSELCTALYFPGAAPDDLTTMTQWMAWAFSVDDEFDDGPAGRDLAACEAAVESLRVILDDPAAEPEGPFAIGLADLVPRLCRDRSRGWCDTFKADVTRWLRTYQAEAVDRLCGRIPAIDDYRLHRRDAVGLLMFHDLCEIASGIDLPDRVRRLPSFHNLRQASTEQIGLWNDICSAHKEYIAGYLYNSVFIVAHHEECSLQEAVHKVNDMAGSCVQRMIDAVAELPGQLDVAQVDSATRDAALHCANDYLTLCRGNIEFHNGERYTQPEDGGTIGAPAYVESLFARSQAMR